MAVTVAEPRQAPRVVIAHDFVETYGGAERIIAEAAAEFPDAPFWAILGRREVARRMGVADRFHTLLPENDRLLRHYRRLAPLYPALVRARALPPADVLLTSSYAFAHGFRTRNHAPHVCYCYSPLRFAWSMTEDYERELARHRFAALGFRALAAGMRAVDRRAAGGVDLYLTESEHTADQIRRFYDRPVRVVGAPVDCARFTPGPPGHDGYYLFCGRMVEPYKRPSIVVEAFARLPHRLVVAGDGPELPRLRAIATPNVEFTGHLDDDRLIALMRRCAATILPSREDGGVLPLEVMACGRPVLAFGEGGAVHTVAAGISGEFFHDQTVEGVIEAVSRFDPDAYDPEAIRARAERWDRPHFRRAVREAVISAAGGASAAQPAGVRTTSSPPSSS